VRILKIAAAVACLLPGLASANEIQHQWVLNVWFVDQPGVYATGDAPTEQACVNLAISGAFPHKLNGTMQAVSKWQCLLESDSKVNASAEKQGKSVWLLMSFNPSNHAAANMGVYATKPTCLSAARAQQKEYPGNTWGCTNELVRRNSDDLKTFEQSADEIVWSNK
jgi:hypothetical protein